MIVAFEGCEGCGKTSQLVMLRKYLDEQGVRSLSVREPGGTEIGEEIRSILLNIRYNEDTNSRMRDEVEVLLFSAARAQLVREFIGPILESEKYDIVICDRSFYSTLAYQGYGRKLSVEKLKIISDFAVGNIKPDLVLLLDIDPAVGISRKRFQNEINRLDLELLDFHIRVRNGYLSLAKEDPKLWRVIDASCSMEELHEQIVKIVMGEIKKFN